MASLLTKFLPIKDTASNIEEVTELNGQALFETDNNHKLYVDYPKQGEIATTRHVVIDSNIALADFSTINSCEDNSGYNAFSLSDENGEITYVSIPHTRYERYAFTVSAIGDIPVFEVYCSSTLNINEYKFFLELLLTSKGGIIDDNGVIKNAFCYNIKPKSIEFIDGNETLNGYGKVVITYPPFDESLYGVSIPTNDSLLLYLYIYTKSNNSGCDFWITGED